MMVTPTGSIKVHSPLDAHEVMLLFVSGRAAGHGARQWPTPGVQQPTDAAAAAEAHPSQGLAQASTSTFPSSEQTTFGLPATFGLTTAGGFRPPAFVPSFSMRGEVGYGAAVCLGKSRRNPLLPCRFTVAFHCTFCPTIFGASLRVPCSQARKLCCITLACHLLKYQVGYQPLLLAAIISRYIEAWSDQRSHPGVDHHIGHSTCLSICHCGTVCGTSE